MFAARIGRHAEKGDPAPRGKPMNPASYCMAFFARPRRRGNPKQRILLRCMSLHLADFVAKLFLHR
jgi:hypothetical protein